MVQGKLVEHHFHGTPLTPDKELVNWNENTEQRIQATKIFGFWCWDTQMIKNGPHKGPSSVTDYWNIHS